MKYKLIVIFIFFLSKCFGQTYIHSPLDTPKMRYDGTVNILKYLFDNHDKMMKICFSLHHGTEFYIITKSKNIYEEYRVLQKKGQSPKVIMDQVIPQKDIEVLDILFNQELYWDDFLDLGSDFYKDWRNEKGYSGASNMVYFLYLDENNKKIAEFFLPIFVNVHPWEEDVYKFYFKKMFKIDDY